MSNHAGIDSLPNELFAQVLMPFPTRNLLPLAGVSHRFYDLILKIIHYRLLKAASLQDHKLILECFHPSAKLTTPGLICDYIGTDGLSNGFDSESDLFEGLDGAGRLRKLSGIYSHFRPVGPDEARRPRRQRHPAGDVLGFPATATSPRDVDETPSQIVSLESHELFSQLCTIANLVRAVPNVGFLLSCVTIGEGVIRIWRDWLAERAVLPLPNGKARLAPSLSRSSASGGGAATAVSEHAEHMLWLDSSCNVGIRVRVVEREDLGTPILMRLDEDPQVAYSIEYEELVIRTSQLLLKVEESLLQETNDTTIIFGSWMPTTADNQWELPPRAIKLGEI